MPEEINDTISCQISKRKLQKSKNVVINLFNKKTILVSLLKACSLNKISFIKIGAEKHCSLMDWRLIR